MHWRVQFVALAATWGSSFLFIKVLGEHWPALWIAFGRVVLGALTLIALTAARRERPPRGGRIWLHLTFAAALFNAAPFTLYAYAEKHVPSLLAGLWNATTPLWVLALALAAFPEERPTREKAIGLAIGFAGVILLLGPWHGLGGGELAGQLACAGAAACYGVGFLYIRRYLADRTESGIALSAAQLSCAAVILALMLPLAGPAATAHLPLDAIGSLLALGILGSGVAYALNYATIRAAGATVASTVTYLIPVFSTLLGVIVLGEALTWNQPVGAVILLTGIAVSQGRFSSVPTRSGDPRAPGSPRSRRVARRRLGAWRAR